LRLLARLGSRLRPWLSLRLGPDLGRRHLRLLRARRWKSRDGYRWRLILRDPFSRHSADGGEPVDDRFGA
jgi:hypothetical protein